MKTKKIQPERLELIQLSQQAKELREQILLATGEELTINQTLILIHKEVSGASTFKTFNEWKEAGFKVKRHEKAFRVWAKPRKGLVKNDAPKDTQTDEEKYSFYPMCCLFNELQVEAFEMQTESN